MKIILVVLLYSVVSLGKSDCVDVQPSFNVPGATFSGLKFKISGMEKGIQVEVGSKTLFFDLEKDKWCEVLGKNSYDCTKSEIELTNWGRKVGVISVSPSLVNHGGGEGPYFEVFSIADGKKDLSGRRIYFQAGIHPWGSGSLNYAKLGTVRSQIIDPLKDKNNQITGYDQHGFISFERIFVMDQDIEPVKQMVLNKKNDVITSSKQTKFTETKEKNLDILDQNIQISDNCDGVAGVKISPYTGTLATIPPLHRNRGGQDAQK